MAEISISYEGKIKQLDALPEGSGRLCFLASMMTTQEMRRFFIGSDSEDVCKILGIKAPRGASERTLCSLIWDHFNEGR